MRFLPERVHDITVLSPLLTTKAIPLLIAIPSGVWKKLEAAPELVNEKPYEVWLFKIKPNSEEALLAELKQLMGIDQYKASAGA